MIDIDKISTFCKKKGFVYPSSEIYGGLSGFFDLGPLGVELNNNIRSSWWKRFVQGREEIVGIDGSIITHQKIWEASGHLSGFSDLVLSCSKCRTKVRADHYLKEQIEKGIIKDRLMLEGIKDEEVNKIIKKYGLKCQKCGSNFREVRSFNLMFPVNIGAVKDSDSTAYLRGETAQVIFADFKAIVETGRLKLPFGIAQAGKAFRNEISPREFLFRVREFEQLEIEFFTHPEKKDDCPYYDEIKDIKVRYYDNKEESEITIGKLPANNWLKYWMAKEYEWLLELGISPQNLRIRQHAEKELAHYASACFDIEYRFPFGWQEIYGNADRGTFDLEQHQRTSGKSMELLDEEAKEKFIPAVASEPSQGIGRVFLAVIFEAYNDDKERGNIVLRLNPKLAPILAGIFPLIKKDEKQRSKAREIFKELLQSYPVIYDESGSVGRRYARADEQGIPACITIDHQTAEDNTVTIRDRDTTKQIRIKTEELRDKIFDIYLGRDIFG